MPIKRTLAASNTGFYNLHLYIPCEPQLERADSDLLLSEVFKLTDELQLEFAITVADALAMLVFYKGKNDKKL